MSGAFDGFWGEHAELLALDTALFRLQLAYRCHLADLCEQRQLSLRPCTAVEAGEATSAQGEFVPEIQELIEREQNEGWLGQLLAENFLPGSSAVAGSVLPGGDVNVIARSESSKNIRNPELLGQVIVELKALFVRHRETQQEY